MEIWHKIDGFNRYYISSMGRVWNGANVMKSCPDKENYLLITLKESPKRKTFKIHRLVGVYFVPNPLNKPEINHLDYNVQNNECYNIEWSTRKENMEHAVKHGLVGRCDRFGEKNGRSKINQEIANNIRELSTNNHSRANIASLFNISIPTVNRILNNKSWTK